jgi:hypothetical protein
MHLRDDCSHVISEIRLKVPRSLRKIQKYQRMTAATREIFPPRVENMDFKSFYLLIVKNG